jgi:subtilisin-like proprotein convertase family protein
MRLKALALTTTVLVLGIATSAHAVTFSNATAIAVPAGAPAVTVGDSDRSDIAVSGVTGPVEKVTATLHGLEHTFPQDLDVLLVGPQGQASYLMSDAGDQAGQTRTMELTFDDSAAPLPCLDGWGLLAGGTWAPTDDPLTGQMDCSDPDRPDAFAAPAPAGPWGEKLAVFNGLDPNGTWSLYVTDDTGGDSGSLAGWSLDFTIAPPTETPTDSGGSGSAGSAPSGPVGPPILSTAGTAKVQRVLKQRGLVAFASSNIAAGLVARATVSVPGASRAYRLRPATKQLAAGAKTKVKLSLSKRRLRAVRAILTHRPKLRGTLRLTVTDASGGVARTKLAIRIRR